MSGPGLRLTALERASGRSAALVSLAALCCWLGCGARASALGDSEPSGGADEPGAPPARDTPSAPSRPPGTGLPTTVNPEPVDVVPSEPVPSLDPPLSECDDGTIVRAEEQASIDALRGCVSPYGLQLVGELDLTPLASLERVGFGGLTVVGDTPLWGLERLQESVSLVMFGRRIANLEVFESLRRVEWLTLSSVDVSSLEPLAGVEGIRNLDISESPGLSSLRGLVLPSEMNSVALRGLPALADIAALRSVTRISGSLVIERTAVEALPFEALGGAVSEVSIGNNPRLSDISALRDLESIESLLIYGSALRSAPSFERLTHLRAFGLDSNLLLEATPAFPRVTSVVSFYVSSNPALSTLFGFAALESAEYISISQNDHLTEIDLGNLRTAYQLFIFDNDAADGSRLASELAGVDSNQSRIPLAQQAPLPITPCPWTDDALCDSAFCLRSEDPACPDE